MSVRVYRGIERSPSIDGKRVSLPFRLKGKCPSCRKPYRKSYEGDGYFTNPPIGRPFTEGLYCRECGHEWDVTLKLSVTLELVGEEEWT